MVKRILVRCEKCHKCLFEPIEHVFDPDSWCCGECRGELRVFTLDDVKLEERE